MIARLAHKFAVARLNFVSSNLAIGTATSFVVLAATLGVSLDRNADMPAAPGAGLGRDDLGLRGTLPPSDTPLFITPGRANTLKTDPLA